MQTSETTRRNWRALLLRLAVIAIGIWIVVKIAALPGIVLIIAWHLLEPLCQWLAGECKQCGAITPWRRKVCKKCRAAAKS